MIPAAMLAAALVALVALYMIRPRLRPMRLSAARFLRGLPEAKNTRVRLALTTPLRSVPFWLQLATLALLLAALGLEMRRLSLDSGRRLGVWLLVDNSHSMTTRQDGADRLALARREALAAVDRAERAGGDVRPCFRVSGFDRSRRDLLAAGPAAAARDALETIEAHPTGTDLGLALAALSAPADERCPISHVVVVTDRPAPTLPEAGSGRLDERIAVWRDIGRPVDNIGIEAVDAARDPFTGAVTAITVSIVAWGGKPPDARVVVTGPTGKRVTEAVADWSDYGAWRVVFRPAEAGEHRIVLTPGGAYDGDDDATVSAAAEGGLRVDWRLPDTRLPARLGWTVDHANPVLRVTTDPSQAGDVPTLVAGAVPARRGSSPVELFADGHPLLRGVALDVLDNAGMAPLAPPAGFRTVAGDARRRVWIAADEASRTVLLPWLPDLGGTWGSVENRAATVLFFNGVRWLLGARGQVVPATLRTGDGTMVEPGEGDTGSAPRSHGALSDIAPVEGGTLPEPVWPWLVLAATLVFTVERCHAAYRGRAA